MLQDELPKVMESQLDVSVKESNIVVPYTIFHQTHCKEDGNDVQNLAHGTWNHPQKKSNIIIANANSKFRSLLGLLPAYELTQLILPNIVSPYLY